MYSDYELSIMPKLLAEYWATQMDQDLVIAMLLFGNKGYDNLEKESLVEKFEEVFGESHFERD